MYFGKTKLLARIIIIFGIFLIIFGVWQYYGVNVWYSEVTQNASAVKSIIFFVIGVSLLLIGYVFSRFVRDVQEEMNLIRSEIRNELEKLKNSG